MQSDCSQRFIFDQFDIRGASVVLQGSYGELLGNHHYPACVAELLGQFMCASVLLSSTLKYRGRLSLQARSEGPIALLAVECTSDRQIRGLAQISDRPMVPDFGQLLAQGVLAITIEPERGERYQGLVPMDANSLAGCLEHYFAQSEQLETRLFLAARDGRAAGFMLQQLPQKVETDEAARSASWEHVVALAATLEANELLSLDSESLWYRLYHQENIRVFEPQGVSYRCSCSRERTARALLLLGREQIDDMLQDKATIDMTCEFCNQLYSFDRQSIDRLLACEAAGEGELGSIEPNSPSQLQ